MQLFGLSEWSEQTMGPNDFQAMTWHAKPSVRVRNDAAITLSTGVSTALTFNTEVFDRWGMHSTASNTSRITSVVSGMYFVGGCARFAANATGSRSILVRKNGSSNIAFHREQALATGVAVVTISTFIDLDVGDYIELEATQDSGGNLDVDSTADYSPVFWAAWHSRQ